MMMQRKSALIPLLALILCVTAAILFSAEPASAASSGCTAVNCHTNTLGYRYSASIRDTGTYYIKSEFKSGYYYYYYSKKKNSGFKLFRDKIDANRSDAEIVVNGSSYMYLFDDVVSSRRGGKLMTDLTLIRCPIKGKTKEEIPVSFEIPSHARYMQFLIVGASGNNIYMQAAADYQYLYCYNVESGKTSRLAIGRVVEAMEGSTIIAGPAKPEKEFRDSWVLSRCAGYLGSTYMYPQTKYIYKIASGKCKKVASLGKMIGEAAIIGKTVYYTGRVNKKWTKGIVYQCNLKGKKKKTLGKFMAGSSEGWVSIDKFTKTGCLICGKKKYYQFTFKSKKLKAISKAGQKKAMNQYFDF